VTQLVSDRLESLLSIMCICDVTEKHVFTKKRLVLSKLVAHEEETS